jgi:hypothetical protein
VIQKNIYVRPVLQENDVLAFLLALNKNRIESFHTIDEAFIGSII